MAIAFLQQFVAGAGHRRPARRERVATTKRSIASFETTWTAAGEDEVSAGASDRGRWGESILSIVSKAPASQLIEGEPMATRGQSCGEGRAARVAGRGREVSRLAAKGRQYERGAAAGTKLRPMPIPREPGEPAGAFGHAGIAEAGRGDRHDPAHGAGEAVGVGDGDEGAGGMGEEEEGAADRRPPRAGSRRDRKS